MALAPLILEDGTGKADAESFGDEDALAGYALVFGYSIPTAAADRQVWLRRSFQRMNGYRWLGEKTVADQSGAFPRKCVRLRSGEVLAVNAIPREIYYGSLKLAVELYAESISPAVAPGTSGLLTGTTTRVEGAVTISETYENPGRVMPVSPYAESDTQFRDYQPRGGLFAIRA